MDILHDHSEHENALGREVGSPEVDEQIKLLRESFSEHDPNAPWTPVMLMQRKGRLLAKISLRAPADETDAINCVSEAATLAMIGEADRVLFGYDASAVIDGEESDAFCVAVVSVRGIAGAIMPYVNDGGSISWSNAKGHLDLEHSPDIIDLNQAFAMMHFAKSSTRTHRSGDVDILMGALAKRGHNITWYGNNDEFRNTTWTP